MKTIKYASAILLVGIISLSNPKLVFGKLVYEKDLRQQMVQEGGAIQLQEEYSDPAINVAEPKQQVIVTPSAPIVSAPISQTPILAQQEIVSMPNTVTQVKAVESKSEQLRRQRMRTELQNEDLLTQKLEELRLKDELNRTNQLLGSGVDKSESTELEEKKIGSAASTTIVSTPATSTAPQTVTVIQSPASDDEGSGNRVTITPKGGLSGITNSMYDIESKYSFGLNVGMDLNNYLSFSAGYTYSTYNLNAGSTVYNPYAYQLQKLDLNDNVIDMGLRANITGAKAKLRPYIGAGVGYRRGYLNYDQKTLDMLKNYNYGYGNSNPDDIELSAFLGYIETGVELKISKAISLVGNIRYYNVFSSKQSQPLNPNAFINPYGYSNAGYNPYYGGGYGYNSYGYNNDARNQAGKALADNNFYQLMVGLSVGF